MKNNPIESVNRSGGNKQRYKIGTTVTIPCGANKYYLVVNAHTDLETLQASANFQDMVQTLDGLWREVRRTANATPVSLPLIGGGLSRLNLPPFALLQTILSSIISATRDGGGITGEVRIVLPESLMGIINLRNLKISWD